MKNFALFCLLITVCLPDSLPAQDQQKAPAGGPRTEIPQALLDRLETHESVVYSTYGDRNLELDLYRSKDAGDKKLPGIVCIHGGGWFKGNRNGHTTLAQALADRGFVAATISYRLSGEAPFPAQIHDCKAAVRFLRANAEKFGIDPERIGAIGLSAGGHLTALLATSGGVEELEGDGGHADQSSTVQAAVPMGAQTNFRSHFENLDRVPATDADGKPNIWLQFLGGRPSEVPGQYRLASPITHLDKSDPPMLFISGELDNESTHAEVFRKKMTDLGIPEGLTLIPGAPHAFPSRQNFFDQMVEAAAAWFEQHLK